MLNFLKSALSPLKIPKQSLLPISISQALVLKKFSTSRASSIIFQDIDPDIQEIIKEAGNSIKESKNYNLAVQQYEAAVNKLKKSKSESKDINILKLNLKISSAYMEQNLAKKAFELIETTQNEAKAKFGKDLLFLLEVKAIELEILFKAGTGIRVTNSLNETSNILKAVPSIDSAFAYEIHCLLAKGYHFIQKFSESLSYHSKALEYVTNTLKDPKLEAHLLSQVGRLKFDQKIYPEAHADLLKSLAIYKQLGEDKKNPEVANVYRGIAVILWKQNKLPEAERNFREAAELILNVAQSSKDFFIFNDFANFYLETQNTDEAINTQKQAILEVTKRYTERDKTVMALYDGLFELYYKSKMYHEAEVTLKEQESLVVRTSGAFHPELVNVYFRLGMLHESQGKKKEAAEVFIKVTEINSQTFGAKTTKNHFFLHRIALCFKDLKDNEKVIINCKKYLEIKGEAPPPSNQHKEVLAMLAITYEENKNYPEAINNFKLYLGLLDKEVEKVAVIYRIGHLFYYQEEYTEALKNYMLALSLTTKYFGENSVESVRCNFSLGCLFFKKNDFQQAFSYFDKASTLSNQLQGKHPQEMDKLRKDIATFYQKMANKE